MEGKLNTKRIDIWEAGEYTYPAADGFVPNIREYSHEDSGRDCILVVPGGAYCMVVPQEGEVVAVGSGKMLECGKVAPMEVKKGDRVLFAKYSGNEVKVDDVDYLIIRQSDILAVL